VWCRSRQAPGQAPAAVRHSTGMDPFPTVDGCRRLLHRAGWTVGECAVLDADGREVWRVSGRNGENAVEVEGASQAEAWHQACQQAEALGMLRR
jgi:hypothetical protein